MRHTRKEKKKKHKIDRHKERKKEKDIKNYGHTFDHTPAPEECLSRLLSRCGVCARAIPKKT